MTFTDLLHEAVQTVIAWAHATPRVVAGFFGGMIAMYLVKDTWPRRIFFWLGALPASYYGGDVLADVFGGKEGPYGFICGMFAIALTKRVFIAIEALDASSMLARAVDAVFSVFGKGSK